MRQPQRRHVLSAAAATFLAASPLLATDAQWLNPNGGTWSTAAFWSPGTAPTPDTNVTFNLNSTAGYTIAIPASPPSTAATLTVHTDKPALALNTHTLSLTGPLSLAPASGDNARLTLSFGGTLSSSATAASTLASPGGAASLLLAGSNASFAGPLQIATGGTATVNLSESSSLAAADIELATTPASAATLHATYTLTPTRQQFPPRLTTTGSLYAGGTASAPGGVATFSTNGTVTIPGTLKVYDTGPASPDGTRVNLTGGTLSVGSLDTSGNPARFNWTAGSLNLTNSDLNVSPAGPLGNTLTLAPVVTGSPTLSVTLPKNLTVSGTLSVHGGPASFTNAGSKVTASAIVNAATFTQSAGTLTIATTFDNYGHVDLAGTQSWSPGAVFTNRPSIAAPTATFRSDAGSAAAYNLTVNAAHGYVYFDCPQHLAALTIGGASVTVLPNGSHTVSTHSLTITSPAARLDLTDNPLTLDYTTTSPADQIRQSLHDGTLASTAPDPNHTLSLGYRDTGSSLTVQLTPTGDANLDGTIDADDYALLDKGFASHGQYWWNGDFNYDGAVNASDYLLIDRSLGQAQGVSPGVLAERESQFGPAYVSQLLTSIPEPSLLTPLLALTAPFPLRKPRPRHPL